MAKVGKFCLAKRVKVEWLFQTAPAQKWYETALARLGLGVCIAALMWLLFLYIKRKF